MWYVLQSNFACSPSERLDCCPTCSSQWPPEPGARAVWNLWGRLLAQEEGEGHADCKWQWMVEWIVHVPNHNVWLHSQDDCQSVVVHEVAVVLVTVLCVCGVTAVQQFDFSDLLFIALLCATLWIGCILAFVVWCAILYFLFTWQLSRQVGSRVYHARLAYVYVRMSVIHVIMAYNIHYSLYCRSFIYEGITNQFVKSVFTCYLCSVRKDPFSFSRRRYQFLACMHKWFCHEFVLLLNAGWVQCLWRMCCWRPSCHCWVPCPQNGGPPLWLWWWRIHSITLCSPRGSVVYGGVPCEILWIWRESKGQGWYMFVWLNITWMSACVSNA